MTPRHYQQKAFDDIVLKFNSGRKRVFLQAATGSGKTFIFCMILKRAFEKGRPCILVVRGRSLVDQASRRLESFGVPHGVFMAGDKRQDDTQIIQIASVDTCTRRKKFPPAQFVVIDEAHYAGSKSFKDFLSNYENARWLAVTATPWTDDGLEHLAPDEDVLYPISIKDLVAEGHLCPAKYYMPSEMDSSKVKIKAGEFDEAESIAAFEKQGIIGDVVKHYEKFCKDECTFVFAINIAHAKSICESFQQAGHDAVVITGDDPLEYRTAILDSKNLIISVGTLTTGVDVPRLKNIILCRPTASKNLYVQMLGRGTRPYPGKEFFRVLDHVGNVKRFGFIIDENKASLKPREKRTVKQKRQGEEDNIKLKKCPKCSYVNQRFVESCVECGHDFTRAKHVIKNEAGELVEVDMTIKERFAMRAMYFTENAWAMGHKVTSVYFKLVEEFGEDAFREFYREYRKVKDLYEAWENKKKTPPRFKGWKKAQQYGEFY